MNIRIAGKPYIVLNYSVDLQFRTEQYIGGAEIGRDPSNIVDLTLIPTDQVDIHLYDEGDLGTVRLLSLQAKVIVPDNILADISKIQKVSSDS